MRKKTWLDDPHLERESIVNFYRIGLLCFLLLVTGSADALQMFTGKVREIEATYMPDVIQFYLTEGNAACPAGKTLVWRKSQDNNKAVYAALLSAWAGNKNIRFYIEDNDASCVGKFIYVVE